jgi:hypothetical protein
VLQLSSIPEWIIDHHLEPKLGNLQCITRFNTVKLVKGIGNTEGDYFIEYTRLISSRRVKNFFIIGIKGYIKNNNLFFFLNKMGEIFENL